MALRSPDLPFLPGFTFNTNFGKERFHKSQYFQHLGSVPILADKVLPGIGGEPLRGQVHGRYPSIYCRGEVADMPAWIAFDKQVLTFDGFFQETLQEMRNTPFLLRNCKIFFFLEDGTVKVVEPKVDNSGIPQGTLISRQRIRMPSPRDDQFYDIIDFNVGREIEFFGKVFKLTNCDRFTRTFLNRCGIQVPDPVETPDDPYLKERKKINESFLAKKPNRNVDVLGQFLHFDRKVLRFYGYWDDRRTEDGRIHDLEILFYLADDTIEIKEFEEGCGGKTTGTMFIKRAKLPKFYSELPSPGYNDATSVLNVLGPSMAEGRFVLDPLNAGCAKTEYYHERDLAIGAAVNCYGRKIVLTDCDPYTKEFYRLKYGLDNFATAERPKVEREVISVPLHQRKLPPWNGFGTFEDSAQNCITVEPKQIMRDFKKFLTLDREGMDSRILRFKARMLSKTPENCSRKFLIYYYLADSTISIFEVADSYSGTCFLSRGPIKMPGQEVFTSEPPDYYEPHHMYVGATVNLNGWTFILTDADEYALRWMELHPNEFPKANIKHILDKIRTKLKPIYKDFVAEFLPSDQPIIPYNVLRDKLCKIMGEDFSEHEMITLARHFSGVCRTERHTRNFIRQIVLTELKKMLWDDLERFKEYWREYDTGSTGYLPRKEVYTLIRACKIPLDVQVIEQMLNVLNKKENCEIEGRDLFHFLDRNYCPMTDLAPLNHKVELWWASEHDPVAGRFIDWCAFNKGVDLEHLFKEPVVLKKDN